MIFAWKSVLTTCSQVANEIKKQQHFNAIILQSQKL